MTNCALNINIDSKNKISHSSFQEFLKLGGKLLTVPSINANNKQEVTLGYLNFRTIGYDFSFEDDYQTQMKLVKEKLFEFESLDEFIYYYPLHSGFHYVSKILPFTENDDDHLVKSCKNIFKRLFNEKIGLKHSNLDFSQSQSSSVFQIYTSNKLLQSASVIESYLTGHLNKNAKFCLNTCLDFNEDLYFQYLKKKQFGSILLYTDVTTSTMNIFESLPNSIDNLIVVAKQQIQGQGNNKNEWLSPTGCCMFTIFMNTNTNKFPASRFCLLQFAAALSCVKAIKSEPNHENLSIGIKWPNDVYYDKKTKIGGILARSSFMGDQIFAKIGIGFNLNNEHPTECLNKILRENGLPEWKSEMFIAKFLNEFYDCFQKINSNVNEFIKDFQSNWLHENQKVKVELFNEEVQIIGIDEFGYLKVKKQDNRLDILQPDGNRFDYMHNLIALRNSL